MSTPPPRSIVRILTAGVALSIGACGKDKPTTNGPGEPTRNPPAPGLPTWDEVESGHPEGATNPPSPVLEVTADGSRCFKAWHPGMMPWEPEMVELGGRVLTSASDAKGTEIICPEDRKAEILQKHAERQKPVEQQPTRNPPPPGDVGGDGG